MSARLLTAREVADRLAVSTETVLRWVRDGELPGDQVARRSTPLPRGRDRGWLEERATPQRGALTTTPGAAHAGKVSRVLTTPKTRRTRCQRPNGARSYRLGNNGWGLRYYDDEGKRRRKSPFPSQVGGARGTTAT